jgi:hypothetical protein
MNNIDIIDIIESYNNQYDAEKRFPSLIDENFSKNKVKDLRKLKKEIIIKKKNHQINCKEINCGTTKLYNKCLEIIESQFRKNRYKNLAKFWWTFIIPVTIGLILFFIEKMN